MGKKVLLIEDDPDLRETTVELLRDEGFEALAAENGAQGIQMSLLHIPDVVVCDINMPGLSGYEVYNMLHQVNTTSVIPFIFLSAKSTRDDILAGLHLGADDYITKPFEFDNLVAVIKRRIERRKRIADQHDENFKVLFENTRNPAFILNQCKFDYVNRPFSKMVGYNQEQIEGMSVTNILSGGSLTQFSEAAEQCKGGLKTSFNLNVDILLKDKRIVNVDLVGMQIQFRGQPCLLCTLEFTDTFEADNEESAASGDNLSVTKREVEVLDLICQGFTNAEIAEKLFLSERTVEGHRSRLFSKTGTKNAVALAMWAVKNNIYKV